MDKKYYDIIIHNYNSRRNIIIREALITDIILSDGNIIILYNDYLGARNTKIIPMMSHSLTID